MHVQLSSVDPIKWSGALLPLPKLPTNFRPQLQPYKKQSALKNENRSEANLSIRILKTQFEKQMISHLRQYAPIGAEQDLAPGVVELESEKDKVGIVMAISLDDRLIATIRVVPTGYGLTLTEKVWGNVTSNREMFGAGSFEVGRLIAAPEYRRADLLPKYLGLALSELIQRDDVQYLHASCSVLMARLYRRFGFTTERVIQGENGLQHALIYGKVLDVAKALKVSTSKIPLHEAQLLNYQKIRTA